MFTRGMLRELLALIALLFFPWDLLVPIRDGNFGIYVSIPNYLVFFMLVGAGIPAPLIFYTISIAGADMFP